MPGPNKIQVDNTTLDPDRSTLDFVSGTGIDLTASDVSGSDPRAKITVAVEAASLSGTQVATMAAANAVGGIPVLHRFTVASGANGDSDITLTHKTLVTDFWVVLKGAGTAGSTVTLKNGSSAISDAIDVSGGGDKDVFRAGEIDDAQSSVAAAGTLRVSKASTGADFPGAECFVLGIRVA